MNIFLKITLGLFLTLTIFACSEDVSVKSENETLKSEIIDLKVAFNNNIGFLDSKSQKFEKINEKQLINYWKNTFDLSKNIEFENAKLIKAEIDKGEKEYYIINAISKDGRINISSKVYQTESGFKMAGEECKCESQSCAWSGCEVIRMCACSSCNGDCKKTHILKNELSLADFQ